MRIAIDARYIRSVFSGIGSYSINLLEALSVEDRKNEYVVVVHNSFRGELQLGSNFEVVRDGALPVSLRTMATMHRLVQRHGADLLHSLFPLAPLAWNGKLLVTVHDLQPLLDPQFTGGRPPHKRLMYDVFYRLAYPSTLRRADYLIADSYATKHALRTLFPDLVDNTIVVHGGLDPDSSKTPEQGEIDRVRAKYDIPKRFLFYIGSTRPNKNLMMMLEAFEEFVHSRSDLGDLTWVMVLKQDRFFDELFSQIRKRGLLKRIHIHDQVNEAEKRVFYKTAELLYFVTKHEGFGLPVLEAQAQGLPVLASTHSALPEIAGSAAILADPDDRVSIVKSLQAFYGDATLAEKMREAGYENITRFSWQQAAREILDMYNHLFS